MPVIKKIIEMMPTTIIVVYWPLWLITSTPVQMRPMIPNTVSMAPKARFKFMVFNGLMYCLQRCTAINQFSATLFLAPFAPGKQKPGEQQSNSLINQKQSRINSKTIGGGVFTATSRAQRSWEKSPRTPDVPIIKLPLFYPGANHPLSHYTITRALRQKSPSAVAG
jgi:hypothetical protein